MLRKQRVVWDGEKGKPEKAGVRIRGSEDRPSPGPHMV